MTKAAKRRSDATLSLAQVASQTGVPAETLRLWVRALPLVSIQRVGASERFPRFTPDAVIAGRALKRFMALDGATIDDARRILEAAGPGALIAAFGGAPERANADSPARRLQATIREAAAAGLFGEVVAEIAAPHDEQRGRVVPSLNRARLARVLTATADEARKRG